LTTVSNNGIVCIWGGIIENKKGNRFELAADNWVNKSNALNEVRNNRMTISQIRFFTIYLSKINPKKIESREVTFRLEEYTKIMQFKQTNITRLIKTAEDLLGLTVKFWDKSGDYSHNGRVGFVMSQLFKRFKLYKNDDSKWVVTIDCHDDVVKLMFDLQKYYFKYELWNALQLTSPNQQRMYEILKQYEKVGERIVTVKDLREYLGLRPEEYTIWQNFKKRVLDASQEALARYTDIKFTWEVVEKKGQGGKINALKFNIEKNIDYIRQFTLEDYLVEQDIVEYEDEPEEFERPEEMDEEEGKSPYEERMELFSDACGNEFSEEEIKVLYDLMIEKVPHMIKNSITCYHYFQKMYNEMNRLDKKSKIKHRFSYIKSLIGRDI
jgi:plasmid replication initiation protein